LRDASLFGNPRANALRGRSSARDKKIGGDSSAVGSPDEAAHGEQIEIASNRVGGNSELQRKLCYGELALSLRKANQLKSTPSRERSIAHQIGAVHWDAMEGFFKHELFHVQMSRGDLGILLGSRVRKPTFSRRVDLCSDGNRISSIYCYKRVKDHRSFSFLSPRWLTTRTDD
jgi:hypothetical protein